MTSEQDLRIARVGSALLANLNAVDDVTYDRRISNAHKAQLITEALEEVAAIATPPPLRCPAADCPVTSRTLRPASLIDHGL